MNNTLEHHGVLGMKWGVRRYQNADGTLTAEGKRRVKQNESVQKKRNDSKYRGTLTDEQIIRKIERLQREKQLKDLTDSQVNAGRKKVASILENVGTRVVSNILIGGGLYLTKAAISKKFDPAELGNAVFNGGPKKK